MRNFLTAYTKMKKHSSYQKVGFAFLLAWHNIWTQFYFSCQGSNVPEKNKYFTWQYCCKKHELRQFNKGSNFHENMFCSRANHLLRDTLVAQVQLCCSLNVILLLWHQWNDNILDRSGIAFQFLHHKIKCTRIPETLQVKSTMIS